MRIHIDFLSWTPCIHHTSGPQPMCLGVHCTAQVCTGQLRGKLSSCASCSLPFPPTGQAASESDSTGSRNMPWWSYRNSQPQGREALGRVRTGDGAPGAADSWSSAASFHTPWLLQATVVPGDWDDKCHHLEKNAYPEWNSERISPTAKCLDGFKWQWNCNKLFPKLFLPLYKINTGDERCKEYLQ